MSLCSSSESLEVLHSNSKPSPIIFLIFLLPTHSYTDDCACFDFTKAD
jgi:hypothetical protein